MTRRVRPRDPAGTVSVVMDENQRESFRVDSAPGLEAELFHEGRVAPCSLHNLSAGGAKVTSTVSLAPGSHCTLGVRTQATMPGRGSAATYVSFLMEVLEATPATGGSFEYRLRSMTGPGSKEYEAAARLVFEAQRALLARGSGAEPSSPMVTDPDRRRRLRVLRPPRFTKRSLRPGQHD